MGISLRLKPVPWCGWLGLSLVFPCILLDMYRGAVAISMSSLEVRMKILFFFSQSPLTDISSWLDVKCISTKLWNWVPHILLLRVIAYNSLFIEVIYLELRWVLYQHHWLTRLLPCQCAQWLPLEHDSLLLYHLSGFIIFTRKTILVHAIKHSSNCRTQICLWNLCK